MEFIFSNSESEMGNLPIPLLNLRDYYDVTEGSERTATTLGFKNISFSVIKLTPILKDGITDEAISRKMAIALHDNSNKISVRIPTNTNIIKYILCYEYALQLPVFCDINEKTTTLDTSKYAFLPGGGQVTAKRVCIFYYVANNGKKYYLITPHGIDGASSIFVGTYDFYCWDDFASVDIQEKSEEYGDYSNAGGYGGGSFDDSSDAFGLPSLPSLGVSEAGFVNVYKPTVGQLVGFADDLFPDFEMPTPSKKEGIDGVVENLNNVASVLGFFADSYLNKGLVDYVIDCHIVPVAPSITNNVGIKVGYKTFNYNPSKVTSDYVEFDCGTLQIAEYYQNFLDYEGTRAKLYAPFIGFVDIKPEWFQSGSLRLVYHFNIIDGSCIAFVIATSSKSKLSNTVVATFGGNCCVHMPITGLNYSSMISGVLGGANKVLSGQIARGAEQIATARPSIEQSNGYNAGMSFMCYRRPYLLIERPVASFSKDYPKEQGLPLNVTKKLGSLKGFTTCTAPIVDNFHCLEEEKELIKQALIEGTIF